MSGRHVICLTNSERAADIVQAAVAVDFADSMQRHYVAVAGYGACIEISVDADEFERWVVAP